MQDLAEFRQRLQSLVSGDTARPFVCSGNPLECRLFVVGFNPATTVGTDFWRYWSDTEGFDKFHFMEDYLRVRKLRGARPRIEAMVDQFPSNWSFETNICSIPTKRASDLAKGDRRTAVFQFLFEAIKPEFVFVHSNQPIEFFQRATGCEKFDRTPQTVEWCGHRFTLFGRLGPIWKMAVSSARELGSQLASHLWDGPEGDTQAKADGNPLATQFAERFSPWSIKLPFHDLERRRSGKIAFNGWWIQYYFGEDRRGEYLDYLAEHRLMSGGEHVRIYTDGGTQHLPALPSFEPVSDDPVENQKLQAEFIAQQREVSAMLAAKGLN